MIIYVAFYPLDPRRFVHLVNAEGYNEAWGEGLDIFHNPRAKYPIDARALPGTGHHRLLEDGTMASVTAPWHPLSSVTQVFVVESEEEVQRVVREGVDEASA